MKEKRHLILIGASGHGKVIADIARRLGYKTISFLDDNESLTSCMGYPVIGKSIENEKYPDADFTVAIGNSQIREYFQCKLLDKKMHVVTLIHPSAVVAENVMIGIGTVIMAGAIINSDSMIGCGCIINTGATVDHDNVIEDYVHVSVGSHLAGAVHIGKASWIGAGAIVNNNITIHSGCTIGAGAVVVSDISQPGIYAGVPAKNLYMK